MVAAYVSPWECSGVCLVDDGFETVVERVYVTLVVYLSTR